MGIGERPNAQFKEMLLVDLSIATTQDVNMSFMCIEVILHFAEPGHVTYPPLKLRLGTLSVPEMKRAGKTK